MSCSMGPTGRGGTDNTHRLQSGNLEMAEIVKSFALVCKQLLYVHGQAVHEGSVEGGVGSNVLQTQTEQRTHSCNMMTKCILDSPLFFSSLGGDSQLHN